MFSLLTYELAYLPVWAFYLDKSYEKAIIWVRYQKKFSQKKNWPINSSNLHIQDGSHQYVAIHHISLTSHCSIVVARS